VELAEPLADRGPLGAQRLVLLAQDGLVELALDGRLAGAAALAAARATSRAAS